MIAGNGVDMWTTSIIAFPLAVQLAYFCVLPRSKIELASCYQIN